MFACPPPRLWGQRRGAFHPELDHTPLPAPWRSWHRTLRHLTLSSGPEGQATFTALPGGTLRTRSTLFLAAAALVAAVLGSQPLEAKLPFVKKAQALGFKEIESCASCHTSKTPKKGEPLAERGKWLVEQKAKHKAEEIDLNWLKDYKGK